MANRKIELFTAGCPVCEPVVELVKSMACTQCEVLIYNLSEQKDNQDLADKFKAYNITSIPAVVINGKLFSQAVTQETLATAGIGSAN